MDSSVELASTRAGQAMNDGSPFDKQFLKALSAGFSLVLARCSIVVVLMALVCLEAKG